MNTDKIALLEILDDIREIIENNTNEDGSMNIDMLKSRLALEFAKKSIEYAVIK